MINLNSFNGAGILPSYYQDTTYFLLGQEKFDKTFSDFGGRPQKNESPIDCALRECKEELCVLPELPSLLANERLTTKFTFQKKIGKKDFIYHLYIVSFNEHPQYFNHIASNCSCLPCSFKRNEEKSAIMWFKADEVYHAVFATNGIITINGSAFTIRPAFQNEIQQLPGYSDYVSRLIDTVRNIPPFIPNKPLQSATV